MFVYQNFKFIFLKDNEFPLRQNWDVFVTLFATDLLL